MPDTYALETSTAEITDHDAVTLALAANYEARCKAVQPLWLALLATPYYPDSDARREAAHAYGEACASAREARNALIRHVSRGHMEVGQ